MKTLGELIEGLPQEGLRLLSLADGSVNGLMRWWATLEAKGPIRSFGEGASPREALLLAKAKMPKPFVAPKLEDLL